MLSKHSLGIVDKVLIYSVFYRLVYKIGQCRNKRQKSHEDHGRNCDQIESNSASHKDDRCNNHISYEKSLYSVSDYKFLFSGLWKICKNEKYI